MFLIVGLGNPGPQYQFTRHNVGFLCIDYLSQRYNINVSKVKHKAIIGEGTIEGQKVILAKPQTYMNLSGESVKEIAAWHKIPNERIIIIYDDVSLETGRLRVRPKGSAGGHNGIKSIIYNLNSDVFPRVRIGVGQPSGQMDLADFVLSKFPDSEKETMFKAIEDTSKAVEIIMKDGIQGAMNSYN